MSRWHPRVGTGRLAVGGTQQPSDTHADLTVLGTYVDGGLSFGMFGASRHVMAAFAPAQGGLTRTHVRRHRDLGV